MSVQELSVESNETDLPNPEYAEFLPAAEGQSVPESQDALVPSAEETPSADRAASEPVDFAAERAKLEEEYQRREWSIRGNLLQEQRRREAAEQAAKEHEQRYRDVESDYDRKLQAARDASEDFGTRQLYQAELDKRASQREATQAQMAAREQTAAAQAIIAQAQERESAQAAAMMREATVPTLTEFVTSYGKQLAMPDDEVAAVKTALNSPATKALFAGVDPRVLPHVLRGFGEAIEQLLPLMNERSKGSTQAQAASSGTYRREGTGAGGTGSAIENMSDDELFNTIERVKAG